MAQQVRAPATQPEDLRLILGIHKVEGENQSPKVVLWAPLQHICLFVLMYCVYMHTHTHTSNKGNKIMNTNMKKYTKPDPL